ncbi:hypothetical protein AN641_07145 [Candidatus Epulonipiscioides gigas]|nr:hypothetical protein AN641_07145 [Epulopiscium sp. SCG-C07WGA-EpuloA2]
MVVIPLLKFDISSPAHNLSLFFGISILIYVSGIFIYFVKLKNNDDIIIDKWIYEDKNILNLQKLNYKSYNLLLFGLGIVLSIGMIIIDIGVGFVILGCFVFVVGQQNILIEEYFSKILKSDYQILFKENSILYFGEIYNSNLLNSAEILEEKYLKLSYNHIYKSLTKEVFIIIPENCEQRAIYLQSLYNQNSSI